ncbi:MAG: hypothetical protein JOZ17_23015 [Acetobacteraceae bacterium]|nr:hypothetical protein [Acetobacteraceae bacterium]
MEWPCPQPKCFVEDFALILSGLWSAIAPWQVDAGADLPSVAQAMKRVNRLRLRFLALVAAFRAGRLRPPRPGRHGGGAKGNRPKPVRLPSKFGWMLRYGSEVACRRSQLEHWLTTNAEAAALIAEVPQSRRILRPLCHMLGIELPEAPRLPPRPKRKRQRTRKPERDGAGSGSAEGSARSRAVSPRAATGKPTKAEILSWMPGQKRPMPWSRSPARNKPPPLIRPTSKMA